MSMIAERVAAGAAYLDLHDPGWFRTDIKRAINLDRLDLGDAGRCVLGQRCPRKLIDDAPAHMTSGYEVLGARWSGLTVTEVSDLDGWALPLGFQAARSDAGSENVEYMALTAEWRRVIEGRRAAL